MTPTAAATADGAAMVPGRRRLAWIAAVAAVAVAGLIAGVARALDFGGRRAPTAALGAPRFVAEAATAGVEHTYGGEDFFVGGGVAVFDCSGDGRPDLYLAGGERPAALYRNESPVGGPLRFTAARSPVTDLERVVGAYPLDVDGDGEPDLAVLRRGENLLLRGVGGCRFERANEAWGFDGGEGWTTAFSATWEQPSGLPTLAFGDYLRLDAADGPDRACADSVLVRPDATAERYGAALPLAPGFCALSMLFSDWDDSGRRDLRVSNDRHYYDPAEGEEQLWRVERDQAPRLYSGAEGWVRVQIEGMGIASYELTGDTYPEVFLTSQAANRLMTLTSGPTRPTYRDIGAKRGVNASRPFVGGEGLPSTAWHPEFQDVNNDGFVDLFIAKGNVGAQPDFAQKDPSNLLLGQPDGTFLEGAEAAGILSFVRGRGAALADFDLDGLVDLIKVNYRDPVELWRNLGADRPGGAPAPMGHWIAVRISQDGANRDAIGGWLEVRIGDLTHRRELTVGGGHGGGQLGWLHVGLGPADRAELRVRWPDGEQGPWMEARADRFVEIVRGASAPRRWMPGQP